MVRGRIPGLRSGSNVLIKVDMQPAMQDGIKFFCSANDVILTRGNSEGVLSRKYFIDITSLDGKHIVVWRQGHDISMARATEVASVV